MAKLLALPLSRVLDANGNVYPGALLYPYLTGTTTPTSTYTTSALSVAHANPIVADAGGFLPAIFLDPAVTYRFVAKTSAGASISGMDFDPVSVLTTGEVQFTDTGAGAVGTTTQALLRSEWINAKSFGVVGDGSTNDRTAAQNAINAGIDQGRPIYFPPGVYRIDTGLSIRRSDWLSFATSYAPGVRIIGASAEETIFDFRGSSSALFDIAPDHDFATFKGLFFAELTGFTIRTTVSATAATGILLRSVHNAKISDIHIIGLSGDGIRVDCTVGDTDGSTVINVDRVRIENCLGWGFSAAGTGAANEISYIDAEGLFVQGCGTAQDKAIASFTAANPGVFTITAHGFADETQVYVAGTGKATLDSPQAERRYRLKSLSADTFKLQTGSTAAGWTDLDTTAMGAGGAAGRVWPCAPSSGGIKWKGQVAKFADSAAAVCKNVGFYCQGAAGLGQDLRFEGFTCENNGLVNYLIEGCRGIDIMGSQIYTNQSFSPQAEYFGLLLDATNNTIFGASCRNMTVRATAAETQFTAFAGMGGNIDYNTIKFTDTIWKQSDYTGQRRFSSLIQFPVVPQCCELRMVDATTFRFGPNLSTAQRGRSTPYRRRTGVGGNSTTGEWVELQISGAASGGLNLFNHTAVGGSATAASTTYNVYLYDNANVATLIASTTATVIDTVSGYEVMDTDATRLFVGRVRTTAVLNANGGYEWEISNIGWLNPEQIPGSVSGTNAFRFFNTADRKTYIKDTGTRPSNAQDGVYVFWPSVEYTKAGVDPGSIAAAGSHQETITTGVTAAIGDFVLPAISIDTAGITLAATATASNTIVVTYFNPTAGAINLASHTLRAQIWRR